MHPLIHSPSITRGSFRRAFQNCLLGLCALAAFSGDAAQAQSDTNATVATYATPTSQVLGGWVNGGNFTIGAVGSTNPGNNWISAESPDKTVDGNTGSKYLLFRNANAGLILKPSNASVVFNRLSLSTANDSPERDPASYIIYGSASALGGGAGTNIPISGLTQIASGTLALPDARSTGPTLVQFANSTAYASYVVVFPTVKNAAITPITQVSEVRLSQGMNAPCAVAMDHARGGQLVGGTFTFGSIGNSNPATNWNASESPDQVLDGDVANKYLIFRSTGAGLLASPQAGPAAVNKLTLWTANDFPERDPASYQVYGFATRVTQTSGTLNVATAGTLLGSGNLTLPGTRLSGPVEVEFINSTAYASYLVVFPAVKNSPATTMTQISELQFSYNGVPAFALPTGVITPAGVTWTSRGQTRIWKSIASSADGTKLAAVVNGGQIYVSNDSGASWTARESNREWYSIASSADGTKLAAAVYGGRILVSTDSGVTWNMPDGYGDHAWSSIASSADGTKLAAVVSGGQIYTSTDSGVTWTARESSRYWQSIASSEDGVRLGAVAYGGQIYTSTNSGVTWTARASSKEWKSIASSADGAKLAAVVNGGQIHTSTDSGATWTANESYLYSQFWTSIVSSADGAKLAAVVNGGQIYVSNDSGASWTARESNREWYSIASSADGAKLAAVEHNGQIHTSIASAASYHLTVDEDSGSFTRVDFATGMTPGIGDVGQTVSLATTNDNNALFSAQPTIAADGTLSFTPAPNANGSATVTVVATDNVGLSSGAQSFTIQVTSVIDVPVMAVKSTSALITANSATLGGEVMASEATVTERGVVYSITSANATPQVGGTGVTKVSASGTIGAFTVNATSLTGSTAYSFRAYVINSAGTSYSQVGSFTTEGVNNVPAFTLPAGVPGLVVTVAEDSGSFNEVGFATGITPGIGDVGQTVSLAATNNNNVLFTVQPSIAADGTLVFTPAPNANGSATVTVVATDSTGLQSSQSFTITVTSVIDAPVLAATPTSASIAASTATLGGVVTASEGTITERGVLYAKTNASAAPEIGGAGVIKVSSSGMIGAFTVNATGLTESTAYSFRAYATNSAGTSYSEVGTFTTDVAPNNVPTFKLPADVMSESDRWWESIASSADGTKLAAVAWGGQIYTSIDFGTTWTPRESDRSWISIASSADGTKLAAVVNEGLIYTSTDSGMTWTARDSNRKWYSIASSADGTKLTAVVEGGRIYTSTDSGVTWMARASNRQWCFIASSADGIKLAAVVWGGQIYTSADSGVTWTARESNQYWYSIASSADGAKLAAVVWGGQIYTSIDFGTTWTPRESDRSWISIASSADGTKLAAVDFGGQIYASIDSGATWTARASSQDWFSIASSADGTKLAAVVQDGQIYTSSYNLTVAENSGSFFQAFATDITPGIGDIGQTVSFAVTNDNTSLFSVQPTIAADGILSFAPSANARGSATVTVVATDSVGLATASQTFTITVTSEIHAPVLAATPTSASITATRAALGGEVVASEATVTERGMVYSMTSTNAAPQIGGTGVTKVNTIGTIGAFIVNATSLSENTTYSFSAYAISSGGTSYSEVETFTTLRLPTLTPSTQTLSGTYGTAVTSTTAFTPAGVSGTVTYSVSPSLPAGLSLDTGTGVISGTPTAAMTTSTTYTITGTGASSGSATATVALTVAKAPLTVTAVNQSRSYGVENPSFSVTFSGFVNGDTSAVVSGAAGFVTDATPSTHTGTYPIAAGLGTLSAANYRFGDIIDGALTITKAAQTVTFPPLLWWAPSPVPSWVALCDLSTINLAATSSGGLPVTLSLGAGSAAALNGTPGSYSLADIGTTGTGTVTVFANQAGDDNYEAATQVDVTFGVMKVVQRVRFIPPDFKTYGDSPFKITGASTDSALPITYQLIDGPATLNGDVLTINGAGFVVIRAVQAGNDYYEAHWADAAFGVAPKTLTVTGALAADKVADGTTAAVIKGAQLTGMVDGDDVTLINGSAGIFSQSTAGSDLTVTSFMRLAGADADNYTLMQPTLTANITAPAHTHQEEWRFANFGGYLSEADAADNTDPDHDGLNNLLEYALGFDPHVASVIPATLALNGANLEYTYVRSTAAKNHGATYQIEWSDTLEAGNWSTEEVTEQIQSTEGALETVKASLPASTGGKRFLRLQVAAPVGDQ